MKVFFELYDLEDESIMYLKGKEYIPLIGTTVYFSDSVEDKNRNIIGIDCYGVVNEHFYDIENDRLTVMCKINEVLNDSWYEHLEKFYTIKNQKL
jgi:hypothetical protein